MEAIKSTCFLIYFFLIQEAAKRSRRKRDEQTDKLQTEHDTLTQHYQRLIREFDMIDTQKKNLQQTMRNQDEEMEGLLSRKRARLCQH